MRLGDVIDFNPTEKLEKNTYAKKIGMDKLSPFYKYIDSFEYEKYSGGAKFRNDDTIVARITPCLENGKTAYVDLLDDGEIAFGSTEFIVMRNRKNVTIPEYVYYLSISPKFREKAISLMTGTSGRQRVQLDPLKEEEFDISSIHDQIKMVKILSAIDEKIKLNNKINNNLHDLCNNLYFKLVSQLNDTNSSVESIKNVAKCVLGGTPSRTKKEYWNGSINWINSGEINKFRIIKASEKITELGLNKSSTTLLPRGTTVLAITGATLGQVSRLEIDSCANQSVIGIITNKKELNNYMYLSILNSINDLVLKQTGGAQQHINKNDVETHEIIVPSTELISQFDEIIRPLFDQISVNCFEINKLEQLRDTLLPKLMNGEIDLDNIEI